ncbi:hypothetical protein AALO_G00202690 [Alosa alosa]|uniref:Uncharacterized protein n=1 Tax=Alosa alosa TaxID=278164 RepID=A0AAV6G7L4_9TELE|nr:hypothetical protein AALO_G00202690 [Alosa alosa]
MAVMAKVVVLVLIATFSNVFCLPKRHVTEGGAHEVDVSTTLNPNNQTQTDAQDGASEDDVTTSSATDGVTDGASEDAVVLTTVLNLQNGTTSAQDGTTITGSAATADLKAPKPNPNLNPCLTLVPSRQRCLGDNVGGIKLQETDC